MEKYLENLSDVIIGEWNKDMLGKGYVFFLFSDLLLFLKFL